MMEAIRYFFLIRKLRDEIAETIRERECAPAPKSVSLQTGVKSTCKACGSIV